jgi:multiple RNA-binding domain-containing protein 1
MSEKTRLVVKGLPSYVNEERLKKVFTVNGKVITDCKLIKKYVFSISALEYQRCIRPLQYCSLLLFFTTSSSGASRCFGFVGFASEQEASQALAYHNNTYLDTARISVDYAKAVRNGSDWSCCVVVRIRFIL